jgi:hypothetical protein
MYINIGASKFIFLYETQKMFIPKNLCENIVRLNIKLSHVLYLNRKPSLHDFSQHASMPHHQPTTSPNSLDLILIFLLRKPPTQ